jgi:PAS domain S-box-containing protein
LIRLDASGFVSGWNAGAQRIAGYAEEEIVCRHFSCFYTAADRSEGVPARALATAEASGTYPTEGWRVRKDGSLLFASVVMHAIRDEENQLVGFAKITRDITARRDAEAKLRQVEEQLAQSQKMEALGQLTGGIAHDFNNMLLVVSGNARLLKQRISDLPTTRAIEAIKVAAARAESLTRQLLSFSRRQPLNPTVISLRRHLAVVRELLTSSVRGNIELAIEIGRNIWPVFVDIYELELTLINLVVNARDAMPDGGRVVVSARNVEFRSGDTPERLSGEFVALSVSDTGCGIDPKVLPKVFERSSRQSRPIKGPGSACRKFTG